MINLNKKIPKIQEHHKKKLRKDKEGEEDHSNGNKITRKSNFKFNTNTLTLINIQLFKEDKQKKSRN